MDQLIQTLIIGLANGLIFALVALGYTLVYGIIELINFAHGDVFMIGSMIAFALMAPTRVGGFGIFPVTAGTPVPLMIVGIILDPGGHHGPDRRAERRHRAGRLPPSAARAEARAADLRDRHELRARRTSASSSAAPTQRTVEAVFPTNNLLEAFGITSISLTISRSSSAW